MVKLCSPFGLSGVVDSSFKRLGGGKSQQIEAHQTDGLRQGEFSLTTPAGSSCLVISLGKRKDISEPYPIPEIKRANHQKGDRTTLEGKTCSLFASSTTSHHNAHRYKLTRTACLQITRHVWSQYPSRKTTLKASILAYLIVEKIAPTMAAPHQIAC